MSFFDWMTVVFGSVGGFFFLAGTVGLLRFPDLFCRLHALTKADNLGLGFIVLALVLQSGSLLVSLKLVLIWLLTMLASSSSCYAIASLRLRQEEASRQPSDKEGGDD